MKENSNCWEYKNCGYEPGGRNSHINGVCPAAIEACLDGVHEGKKGGRTCWMVANTYCDTKNQEDFKKKYTACMNCDFYWKVRDEEGTRFYISSLLMQFMNGTWTFRSA